MEHPFYAVDITNAPPHAYGDQHCGDEPFFAERASRQVFAVVRCLR
jgi:hypothetical protein